MAAALASNQHELIEDGAPYGFVFGTLSTKYLTTTHPQIDPDDAGITNDSQRDREDGGRYGEDWEGGKSVMFEISVITDKDPDPHEANADALDLFESTWRHRKWREDLNRYGVLRSHMKPGRIRRAYGRPRRFSAVEDGLAKKGHSTLLADFHVQDGTWYDDAPTTARTPNGTTPLRQTNITTSGTKDTWLTVTIFGACTSPKIVVGGVSMELTGLTVGAGQRIEIDGRPWLRGFRRSDSPAPVVANFSSTQLKHFRLTPGTTHLVSYSAASMANDSYALVEFRNAWSRW